MRLTDIRVSDYPEDSLAIYQPAIEPLINQTNNEAYHQAVDLIVKVKDVMTRLDREDDFEAFVTQLRKSYKRKRNFIKFLKQRGLI